MGWGNHVGGIGVWVYKLQCGSINSTDSTVGSGLGRFLFCSVEGVPVPVEVVDS